MNVLYSVTCQALPGPPELLFDPNHSSAFVACLSTVERIASCPVASLNAYVDVDRLLRTCTAWYNSLCEYAT
jgi:hypothetical protein